MKKRKVVAALAVLIVLVIIALVYMLNFMPNNNIVYLFDSQKTALVIEDEILSISPGVKLLDEEILLPIDIVKKYFDPYIWWDEALKKVTITTKDKVIRMQTDNLNAFVNNEPVELTIPVKIEEGTVYIPIDFLKDFYNINITNVKTTNVIVIDYRNSIVQVAEPISTSINIRQGRFVREPIVKKIEVDAAQPEESKMRVFEEYEGWYKVRASDGTVGYIQKKDVAVKIIGVNTTSGGISEYIAEAKQWKPSNGMINLVWDVGDRTDIYKSNTRIEGLDVVSPIWFDFENPQGKLKNQANTKSLEWARKNGYQVWPILKNDQLKPSTTSAFLNNTDARDNLIRELLVYSAMYKFDGINIDLENINLKDKDALTQFVRELTPLLKEQNLTVSICVGVPDGSENFSLCYDTKALGEIVDYVMVMAYDQHWSTSPNAGSVAQLSWVEKYLKKTLDLVPREKLFLGLPFYNRLWKEEIGPDGKVKATNVAVLKMNTAKQYIKDNNAEIIWDEVSGQFYAEYKKDNAVYKLWLEDENSINLKSALAQKYKLAGTASWRMNFETPEVWDVLNTNLKVFNNYEEWKLSNKEIQASLIFN